MKLEVKNFDGENVIRYLLAKFKSYMITRKNFQSDPNQGDWKSIGAHVSLIKWVSKPFSTPN